MSFRKSKNIKIPSGVTMIFEKPILKVYTIYQERLKILNSCDFGDLILLCVKMFEKNSDILQLYLNLREI